MNKRVGVFGVLFALSVSGLTAWGNDYYVDASMSDDLGAATSWTTAKQTIQAAVDLTVDGDTVWVSDGTYNLGECVTPDGGVQMNRVCITNSITLRSQNGPGVTIIEGAAGSNGSNDVDSVRGVFMATNSLLTGFTVTGGYTGDQGNYTQDRPAGGVWLTTDCVVSNCVISGNSAIGSGGGIFLFLGGEAVDCTVAENISYSAGAGIFLNYGGMANDCTISNNVNKGYNGGGGVSIEGGGVVNRCVISGNQSGAAAGVAVSYGGTLNNCLIINNTATEASPYNGGGGVNGSEATLNNCTISGNHSAGSGGGFFSGMMGMNALNNCIVWGNTAPEKSNLAFSEWGGDAAQYCCVPVGEGITNGVDGCVTSDPLFVNTAGVDFQLQASSPCVNAGNNPYGSAGIDLAGNPRINNGIIDMGAYEQTATLPMYVITTISGAHGIVTPIDPSVYQGADQGLSISADMGYQIDTMSVDGSPVAVAGSYTFTNVQSAHTFAATFVIDPHFLTINSGSTAGSYTNAQVVSISADSPDAGYEFSHWTVLPSNYAGNLANPSSATTTFTMPQENVELTAIYTGIVEVKNVSVAQRPGTKLVDISYDVFSGATNQVFVSLSVSNGTALVGAMTLLDDIGSVSTGSGRSILWDAGADWDGQVADLMFTVLGVSGGLSALPDSATHEIDSRNYTLRVSSHLNGGLQTRSSMGYLELVKEHGTVGGTGSSLYQKTQEFASVTNHFTSYTSRYFSPDYYDPNPYERGDCEGYANIHVDPEAGTIEAGARAQNHGGPHYVTYGSEDQYRHYFTTEDFWGSGQSLGGTRRLFEVTGTEPFSITLSLNYSGTFSSAMDTYASYESLSVVTLVKKKFDYFAGLGGDMDWGGITDLYGSGPDAYDWFYGENQEVAEVICQTKFTHDSALTNSVFGDFAESNHLTFLVNPGDLILLDDWLSVYVAPANPTVLLPALHRREVSARHCLLTSDVMVESGSSGGLVEYSYFEAKPLGDPVPPVGVHSNYCWNSAVTASVHAVDGYVNTGWSGTGNVPATGSAMNTGPITLSDLDSSITWNWELEGYEVRVVNGSGSGTYTNGDFVALSANPVDFYQWVGGNPADLLDSFSANTMLRVPDDNIILTAQYRASEMYVDAAMPDDSQDGKTWATAKKTIQAAVDMVSSNGTVWVTNGVYDAGGAIATGQTQSSRVCIERPMTVRSVNGADVTTIIGAIGSPENPNDPDSIYAVRGVYLANNGILSGFTIESSCAYSANGSGIWMGTSSAVSNSIIRNNLGAYAGGGVYLETGATLNTSTVESNTSGISGGGVCVQDGTVNCCIIKDNLSDYEGGGVYLGGTLNNSVVDGNSATHSGGGIFLQSGSANNCTIVNSEGRRGAAIRLNSEGSAIYNSILLYNTDWDDRFSNGIQNDGGEMQRCMIGFVYGVSVEAGMLYSGGNLYVHPSLFGLKGTYELWEHSVGVDWGDNAHAPEGKALGGNARIINGRVDLGAYETGGEMADANGNDISDDWEEFFYGANPPPASSLCSNGVNTVEEAYIAGIDPTDPNSRFFVQVDPASGAIFWPLAYGRTYSVYWTPSLDTPFSWVMDVSWTDGFYLDAEHDSNGAGFYKVEVQ